MKKLLATVLISAVCLTGVKAQEAAPESSASEDWHTSKYGPDDTIGALNHLSAEGVLKAAKLVTEGKVYQLGGVTDRDTPAYGHRSFQMFAYPHGDGTGAPLPGGIGVFNDDFMVTWLGIGTQIDGFAHAGIEHTYYNGTPVGEIFDPNGVKKFGTHDIPPIVTRAVLLDMAKHYQTGIVAEGTAFNKAEIEEVAKAQDVTIGEGDVVLFHTGWQALASKDPKRFLAGEPGLGNAGAEYLAGLNVVAVGADTWALEALPPGDFAVHGTLLAKNGVHILENIQTAELAKDGVKEFLFVLGIPRFKGAIQMVINPIGIR